MAGLLDFLPTKEGLLSGYNRVNGLLEDAVRYTDPKRLVSPADVASGLPGGGLVTAWQESGKGRDALKAGDYAGAVGAYGNMLLNIVPEGGAIAKLAALPFIAKAADGKVNLGAVMKDVDRGGLNKLDREDMRKMNRAVDTQDWVEAEVPIRSLYATQPHANANFADAAKKRGDKMDLPLVVRAPDGKMYVRDGHHRLTAIADADGQTARVRLIDLMQSPPQHPELPF